jgi:hypothetical protein
VGAKVIQQTQRDMNFFEFILIAAGVTFLAAWIVNSFVGLLSGERPDGLFSDWLNFFFRMGRGPVASADTSLPDFMTRRFKAGDQVRVMLLPLEVERTMPEDRRALFRRCAGKVLRVESVDEFGGLELHFLDDGTQSPDRYHHVLFVEPQWVEPASQNI